MSGRPVPFTDAGFLRYATAPDRGGISVADATAILARLKEHPGYHHIGLSEDWQTYTRPFFKRLQGHNQITDAYLLGLALSQRLILVTFDKAILHLAAEHRNQVLLLPSA